MGKMHKTFLPPRFFKTEWIEKKIGNSIDEFLAWFGGPRLELQVSTRDHAEYIYIYIFIVVKIL